VNAGRRRWGRLGLWGRWSVQCKSGVFKRPCNGFSPCYGAIELAIIIIIIIINMSYHSNFFIRVITNYVQTCTANCEGGTSATVNHRD
jgi:hypothetical protein